MNSLTIVVLAVFVLFAVSGWRKGLIRKLSGIVALILSSILVTTALPYITEFLKSETPVYEYLEIQCRQVVEKQAFSSFLSGSEKSGQGGMDRAEIKSLMDQYGMDTSQIDFLSDDEVEELAKQYFQEYLDQSSGQDGLSAQNPLSSMTKIEQTKLIENLPIPQVLKDMMIDYNNGEGYQKLNVTDFGGYVAGFFANVILNVAAFIITLLVVQLVLWTGLAALDLFSRLPVLHTINRIGGLAVGILQGLLAVWVIFLVISVLSATDVGISLMSMVDGNVLLKPIYDGNLFMKAAVQAAGSIM